MHSPLDNLNTLPLHLVGRGVIARQSDGLYAPSLELWLQLGDAAQLGGADGCVVVWVRKHHGPTARVCVWRIPKYVTLSSKIT